MTVLKSRDIMGLAGVPASRMGVWKWLRSNHVPLRQEGKRLTFSLSNLPEPVRLAYQVHLAERSGLAAAALDDAAHLALLAKPGRTQERAIDRAAILVFVEKHRKAGLQWPTIDALLKGAGFSEQPSHQTLKRWFKLVENVDPINWAPALAPGYSTTGAPLADCQPDAWTDFENRVAASGNNGTGANFMALHKQTKAEADKNGWALPALPHRHASLGEDGRREAAHP